MQADFIVPPGYPAKQHAERANWTLAHTWADNLGLEFAAGLDAVHPDFELGHELRHFGGRGHGAGMTEEEEIVGRGRMAHGKGVGS